MVRLMGRKINMIFGKHGTHTITTVFFGGAIKASSFKSLANVKSNQTVPNPNKKKKKNTENDETFQAPDTQIHTVLSILVANIAIGPCVRKTTEYNTWILTCEGNIEYIHSRKYVYDSNHANCERMKDIHRATLCFYTYICTSICVLLNCLHSLVMLLNSVYTLCVVLYRLPLSAVLLYLFLAPIRNHSVCYGLCVPNKWQSKQANCETIFIKLKFPSSNVDRLSHFGPHTDPLYDGHSHSHTYTLCVCVCKIVFSFFILFYSRISKLFHSWTDWFTRPAPTE